MWSEAVEAIWTRFICHLIICLQLAHSALHLAGLPAAQLALQSTQTPLPSPHFFSSYSNTHMHEHTEACVRARRPRALAWCDSGFVWKHEVCVEHFQRIYVVDAVTACQIYKAASDPLTRHRCVAGARSKLTHTSQDYYARLFSCAPHILGGLYDFAPCNKQVTTSLCLIRHWAQQERRKLIEVLGTNTPESAWRWAKMGSESWV